jgi:hypothetical protein
LKVFKQVFIMKLNCIFLFLTLLLQSFHVEAQPPALIPYQAIARDAAGNAVLNQNIGLRFSIHDQTITGNVVWQEVQTVLSNSLGVVVTSLGSVSDLSAVNWAQGDKFLQVEMDIAGGTNYSDMGTQQMMSVPYALYAGEANQLTTNNGSGFSHWIGEYFGGGVIFHLWKGLDGTEHGLILDIVNLSDGAPWSNIDDVDVGTLMNNYGFNGPWDGEANSLAITTQSGHNASAASLCLNSTNGGFDDWFLPSLNEFQILYNNRREVARSLINIPNANYEFFNYFPGSTVARLWTSTQESTTSAATARLDFWDWSTNGAMVGLRATPSDKSFSHPVRAIRSF